MNRKISDSLVNSPDVNLRLAVYFLKKAMLDAKRGNSVDMCTNLRIAAVYEKKVQPELRLGQIAA